jgi:hypothetical protein
VEQPADGTVVPADVADIVSLGIRTGLALVAAIGAYVVMHDTLTALYPGWGAVWRALTPLGVEAIAGHAIVVCFTGRRVAGWLARTAAVTSGLAGIALCVVAELTAASAAPAVAARVRVASVLEGAAHHATATVELQAAPDSEGKRGKLKHEENQGAARSLSGWSEERYEWVGVAPP